MKRPNITPGPWHHSKGVSPAINTQLERTPIDIARTIYGSYDEALANARAIAAVPELLAALETALSVIEDDVLACERRPYPCAATQEAAIARKRARLTKAKDALTKAGYEFP